MMTLMPIHKIKIVKYDDLFCTSENSLISLLDKIIFITITMIIALVDCAWVTIVA